jgi:hypothetical protein
MRAAAAPSSADRVAPVLGMLRPPIIGMLSAALNSPRRRRWRWARSARACNTAGGPLVSSRGQEGEPTTWSFSPVSAHDGWCSGMICVDARKWRSGVLSQCMKTRFSLGHEQNGEPETSISRNPACLSSRIQGLRTLSNIFRCYLSNNAHASFTSILDLLSLRKQS